MNTTKIKKFFDLGLTVIPIKSAKDKAPKFPDWEKVRSFEDIPKFALVKFEAIGLLAEASGVLIIDIDVKNDPTGSIGVNYLNMLKMSLDNYDNLLIQTTPSGGYHIIYKTDPVPKTIKLAKYQTGVVIETRGIGGQALISPSKGYEVIQGSFDDMVTLDPEDSELILAIARSFNKVEDKKIKLKEKKIIDQVGDSPFKKYNKETSVVDLLVKAGWTYVETSDLGSLMLRPGKTTAKHSGIVFEDSNKFYCHTTSTSFETERSYSAFDVAIMTGTKEAILTAKILDKYSEQKIEFILDKETIKAPEFPFEVLPSIVRDYIWKHEFHNVTLPDFSAMTFLTLIGATLGTNISIESRTGWISHATLWCSLCADKGKNKTESMSIIVDPIVKYTNRQSKKYLSLKKQAEDSQTPFNEVNPQFVVNDITFEALGIILNQTNENGVMMIQQELDSWVTSMTEYSDSSKSNKWIGFHDNKSTAVNRVTRNDILIDRPSCPVIGPIQPAILSKLMNDPDMVHSGFIDRLLIVNPDHEFRELPAEEMQQEIIDIYDQYIVNKFEALRSLPEKKYRMNKEAKARFMFYINELRKRQNTEQIQSMVGFYDKISKYFSRFTLIIHMIQDSLHDDIQIATVEAGFKLVKYFIGMNLKTYNQNSEAKEDDRIYKESMKKYPDQKQQRYIYMHKAGLNYKSISRFENVKEVTIRSIVSRSKNKK